MNLQEFAEKNPGLVVVRQSVRYPDLFVVKYHRKVFYKNLWTPELCEMRGLVVDADWNVVVQPFTKVFNRFENGVDIALDETVTVVEKINGFMAAATNTWKHGLVISTTGSLDSDFADMARENIQHVDHDKFKKGYTYLFEIVDPRDPHIIDQISGAYLIGVRNISTGLMLSEYELDVIAAQLELMRPLWTICSFSDVVEDVKLVKHEGYMVYGGSASLKIKSPYYLTKKLFARIRSDKLQSPQFWTDSVKQRIEEEYYPLADYIQQNLETFVSLDEQQRLDFMEQFLSRN